MLKKTRECIRCERLFECEGKPTEKACLHFKERKDVKDGRKKTYIKKDEI